MPTTSIRTAAEHGVRLAAAENTRFVRAYVELEKVIRAGTLGEIRMIRGFIPDQILHEWKDDALGWKREAFGGGAIIDCAPHMLYLLTWLLGETECVQAFARGYVPEIALENHAVICGATKSGTLFAMEFCSVTEYPRGERVEVYGADGAIVIDQVLDPPVVFYRGDQDPKGTPLRCRTTSEAGSTTRSWPAARISSTPSARGESPESTCSRRSTRSA